MAAGARRSKSDLCTGFETHLKNSKKEKARKSKEKKQNKKIVEYTLSKNGTNTKSRSGSEDPARPARND
jgi:hypothetical protein